LAWLLLEILGSEASLLSISTATSETDVECGVLWRVWQGLRLQCFPRGDERVVESNGRCGKAPAHCVVVVATASGSDPVFFTLSGGVCCCSGITVMGPA